MRISVAADERTGVADTLVEELRRRCTSRSRTARSMTSEAVLSEILDAWFAGEPSTAEDDVANIRHVDQIG